MYAKIDAAPLGAEAVHRVAGEAGPALARGGRGRARRLPEAAADRARRDAPDARPTSRGASPRSRRRRSACCPTSRPAWPATCSIASTPRCPPRPTPSSVHPKLLKQFEARDKLWADGEVDWALAEAMAYGSLLLEGTDMRIAGQDTRRGTFSHRHAVLVDHTNGDEYAPLAHLGPEQGKFWIYDSLLSEYAGARLRVRLLGGRQGLAGGLGGAVRRLLERRLHDRRPVPRRRRRTSGTRPAAWCMYLPHGYEGQGPEHSLGARRAVPHAVRRGQHPGRQLHAGVADLPPPAPPGAPRPCASRW